MTKLSDVEKEIILELEKQDGIFLIKNTSIADFVNSCGVWAMVDENEVLLEIGQSSDIGTELSVDLSYLTKTHDNETDRIPRYTARLLFPFSESFKVLNCDKNRTQAKYRTIAEKYNSIKIYRISDALALSSEKTDRERIEMEIAIDNKALYWNAYGRQRALASAYYNH